MNLYRVYSAPYTMSTLVYAEAFDVTSVPEYVLFLRHDQHRNVAAAFHIPSIERIMLDRDGAEKTVWINHAKCTEESGRFFAALERQRPEPPAPADHRV